MNHVWTIARKELRGYFGSALALIFLASFLAATMIFFFWVDKFLARGVADVRPMFDRMPVLLILLVGPLSMRLWSEEKKVGTIELLMTLPVGRWKLVLGKFLAGMILVGLALLPTLVIPWRVAGIGDLDWGPVFGGYLAALLLAAAYLSIGMCVSALTDNQIVALLMTWVALAATYAPALFKRGVSTFGLLMNQLGMGNRFESVARGVLDLRDLAFYGSLVVVFLGLNVLLLGRQTWSHGARTRARRVAAVATVGLLAANALALNLWMAPVARARLDLTEHGEYSLSATTKRIVRGLDEPLLIRGYFSDKTHPKLAPLLPRVRDLLDEYRVVGGGKLRVELIDPSDDEDAKREAKERFGIEPQPLQFASATERSIVNAYFAIAISYGDQTETLGLMDLIEVRQLDIGDLSIKLKNLEYDVTRSIKKVAQGFQSLPNLFASMPGKAELTAYLSPADLPPNWKDAPALLQKVADKLGKDAAGKLSYQVVEPKTEAEMQDLATQYGIEPYVNPLARKYVYFALLLKVGDRLVRVVPPEEISEAALEDVLTDGLKRAAPGFTKVVGLWQPPAPPQQPPMMEGMPPQPSRPPQSFEELQRQLGSNYEVRPVDLGSRVADEIEVLVLGGPADLDAKAAEHVDQFVMRGGALVALAGRFRLQPSPTGLGVEKVTTGLEQVLTSWGVSVGDELVLDKKNESFPVPVQRDMGGGMMMRELRELPYPFFVKITGDALADGSLITGGLPGAVMHWGSVVKAEPKVGDTARKVEVLMRSSGGSWLSSSTQVQPDFKAFPDTGFAAPGALPADKKGAQVMAVAITGAFPSAFGKARAAGSAEAPADAAGGGKLLARSPADTRMVVFGSSSFVSDDVLGLAQQLGSDLALSNLQLVHNAIDWALADTDLLAIRARTTGARALTLEGDARQSWRNMTMGLAVVVLLVLIGAMWLRRRGVKPMIARAATTTSSSSKEDVS